ncbi:MAG: hypothetical protein ACRCXL_10115 [Dermatophilaceae bacterium]
MASRTARWTLDDLLSTARLRPYQAAAGSAEDGMRLYDWNSQVSAAFYESLHYLEVGLRNVFDQELSRWASARGTTESWYTAREVPLNQGARKRIEEARERATERWTISESHGKVVAELSFGFWWSLTADRYDSRLWAPCLRSAFDGPVRRRILHAVLDDFRKLRNRIAHHEPVHNRALDVDYAMLLDTASRISPLLRDQIVATSRIPAVLGDRPQRSAASTPL